LDGQRLGAPGQLVTGQLDWIAHVQAFGAVPAAWSVIETRDYDGDGKSDVLWRDTSGNTAMWFLNGLQIKSTAGLGNIPTVWTIQSANAD
jgi:hypothetical protein